MSEDKRKRSPNWLPSEKELLISLVELNFNIIENKQTDAITIKKKLAQWQIIADSYNGRTTYCSRTAENLKAQWESMKKVARKDAANKRKHMIQTGGGSPLPPTKEDPLHQRILSLISITAVGIFNQYDSDSFVPQAAIPALQTEDLTVPPPIQFTDGSVPPALTPQDKMNDTVITFDKQDVIKDWGDYTPQLLRTPVSLPLKKTGVSRRRPTYKNSASSLQQLHVKKIEAIELQKKLAMEEMERSKASHDLDIELKKEKLKQEKIKTKMLMRQSKRLAFRKNKI